VDLGGTPWFWESAPVLPKRVVCVNPMELAGSDRVETVQGDACACGDLGLFDLVFSNSTIEHVGGHTRMAAFADSVHSLAEHHWIQTPNRYFPIEPHFVFPGAQFMPLRWRLAIARYWRPSYFNRADTEFIMSTVLLSPAEMHHYFPDSRLLRERVAGLTKSLIAVR
jgi:hypothetical protein